MQRLRSFITFRRAGAALAVLLVVALGFVLGPLAFSGPHLVALTPGDGAASVNPRSPIQLEFDQWVAPESLLVHFDPPAEFVVTAAEAPRPWRSTLRIQPKGELRYGASYRLSIDGARNLFGRQLAQPRTVAFATAPYVTVARFGPDQDSRDVPLQSPITVEFDAPVVLPEQVAAAAEDQALADALPQPLVLVPDTKGIGRWLSPTLYGFYPTGGLQAATEYRASVRTDVTPDGGARLEQPVDWRFSTTAPLLIGARPFDGATDVPANGSIEVRLAPNVDLDSAAAHFKLREADTGVPVAGAVSKSNDSLLFRPASFLQHGTRYEALMLPGVSSSAGRPLNTSALAWTFTVMGDLEVVQVEPPPDAAEVPTVARRISVRFNHPVVALTTLAEQQRLPQPLTIAPALAGVGRWLDTSTYVFSPTAGLAPATTYQVSVAAGLQDQVGGVLRQGYGWSFKTITPQVVETTPPAGDQQVDPRDPIQVFFNQPMDQAGLRSALQVRKVSGGAVAGKLAFDTSTATFPRTNDATGETIQVAAPFVAMFTPAQPLERGASYEIVVAAGVRAAQGDGVLANEFRSPFRASPLPKLAGAQPENGARQADPGGGNISLTFSTPMDWDSVWQNMTIEPKPTGVYTSGYDINFSASFAFKPETDYRVTVGAAARDRYGVALGQDAVVSFHTGSLPPSLALVGANQLGAYNAYVAARVPFQHVNIATLDYRLFRIDVADAAQLTVDYQAWQGYKPTDAALIKRDSLNLKGNRNQQRLDLLDLGRLEAGMYYLELRGPGELIDRQIMAVSPYALTIKRSDDNLFVWAVDLATGKPVSDLQLQAATIEVDYTNQAGPSYGPFTPSKLGRTDGDGIVRSAFKIEQFYNPVFLWSAAGAPFTFATTNWGDGINPWDFGLPSTLTPNRVAGNVTTDRPIYRPEQNVYIRGVLRADDDGRYALPSQGRQAHLTINDPEGNTVYSTTLALSQFGTFNTSLPLDRAAKLGMYSLLARFDDDSDANTIYGTFSVAEYRKPAFEIVAMPTKPDLIQGENLKVDVTARYYSGGALANAPVRWRLLGEPLYFNPEAAPNYRFENLDDAYEWYRWFDNGHSGGGENVADGEGKTDAQGRFSVSLPATLGKDSHSRRLRLEVDITDVDGQVLSSEASANVHVGAFYIGLRPEGYVAQVGQPQQVALLTLDPQGTPVGNRALAVKIYRREWFSARQQGPDGRFYFTSTYTDTLVETKDTTTDAQGRGSISFTPKDGGSYRIGAEGRDDGGHLVAASAFTWATGGDVFWGINDTARVDLIADKDRYKPGDTAGILVTAPYKGMTALMTIERGEVIEHKLLTIQGTTELLQVPIVADYAPNVYVSVVLVKAAGDDVPVPDLRIGMVNLPVSTEQQELTISVTSDKPEAGPRDKVSYTVKTTDYSGKGVRAEVSLALVDKAVLALADDPNPTLTRAFYEKRPLGVMTAQSLVALVDRVTLKLQPGSKGGGGGAAAEILVRRDFPDTAYWNPALVTGDDGTATVSVTLPDNLTTWHMTARGVSADTLVGQASQDVVATRPLLIRPTLPRFLTVGDKPIFQAVLHNSTANAIDADATLELIAAEGISQTVKLAGDAQQRATIPAGGTALLRWPAEALRAGRAILRFSVKGGGLEDIAEQVLPVQQFSAPEVVASAGQVGDTPVVETLEVPAGVERGQVELELMPSLAAGMVGGLSYLEQYPYSCIEQTVSRFLPNATTYRLLRQLGRDDPARKAALEQNLAAALQQLYALQNLDGGWGWQPNDESNPYLTAYAVLGLAEARRAGYGVDAQVYTKALAYLQTALDEALQLENAKGSGQDLLDSQISILNSRSYVLFVLAEAGQPDRGRTIALFEQRAKLQIYGRAYLLMALKTLGGEDDRVRTLVGELMGTAILHASDAHWEEARTDYWTMSSDTRTTAVALQALVRADPGNFLIPNAVRYLVGQRDQGHWRTTQESATTLMALGEYLAQSGELQADYRYSAALDGKMLREGTVNSDNLDTSIDVVFALADLTTGGQTSASPAAARSSLQLEKQGKGRLFYTLRMRTFQNAAQVAALDQGIGVQREYVAVDTATLSPTGQLATQVKLGDLVQVRLTLTVPENMRFFAVEDMLPAGLEALDSSLKTVADSVQSPELSDAAADLPYWWFFSHSEVHDNRMALFATNLAKGTYHYTYLARASSIGTFQTLPATAYRMYSPEVFGRSNGTTFVVAEP